MTSSLRREHVLDFVTASFDTLDAGMEYVEGNLLEHSDKVVSHAFVIAIIAMLLLLLLMLLFFSVNISSFLLRPLLTYTAAPALVYF